MGSIGGDAKTSPWYKLSPDKRPEAGLLKIRKSLGLFANLRPAYLYQELKDACPLKEEIIGEGFTRANVRAMSGFAKFHDDGGGIDGRRIRTARLRHAARDVHGRSGARRAEVDAVVRVGILAADAVKYRVARELSLFFFGVMPVRAEREYDGHVFVPAAPCGQFVQNSGQNLIARDGS